MPRLPRDQEIKRRNAVRKLLDDGYDNNYIAEQMGMRPQNALALIRSLENTPEEEIVSNSRQRETLTTITEKVLDDLKDIDELIELFKEKPDKYEIRLEKLYRLKMDMYKEIIEAWAIPQSITSSKQGAATIKSKQMQLNVAEKIDFSKVDKAAAEAAKVLDKLRITDD